MRSPRITRRRLLLALLALSLMGNGLLVVTRDATPVGAWRNREAREAYLAAYREVERAMPQPERRWDVPTAYGTVHVARYAGPPGSEGLTPLVLVPGWGAGIPMWRDNLPGLVARRPVIALDGLGDAGLSTQAVPLDTPEAQAAWLSEALRGIGLTRAHVVGHSFGGWSAANLALRHPDQVATLTLLEPVQVFETFPWQVYAYSIPASVPFLPQSWRDAALARIGGTSSIDRADPMTRMIDEGTKGYDSKRSFPGQLTDDQLRSLRMPVYVALAADSALTKPVSAERRARALVPAVETRLWPGGHSLPMERPAEVDAAVLDFVARHDG